MALLTLVMEFLELNLYSVVSEIKVSKFQNENLVSTIFQKSNKKIVRISAQKSKKCSNQTNKDILLCQIVPTLRASAH